MFCGFIVSEVVAALYGYSSLLGEEKVLFSPETVTEDFQLSIYALPNPTVVDMIFTTLA